MPTDPTPAIRDPQWTLRGIISDPLPGPGHDETAAAWSTAAIAFLGIVDAFFEPDPDFQPPDALS